MNRGILETIINSKSQFPGVTPHCIFFKVECCVVGEGTAVERTYIPGQFVLVREPPCDSCQKAQIVSIITDVASMQTFVIVAWLFERGDLGSIKCLDGPVAHRKELQDLLGPHELLRSNAIDCIPSSLIEDHVRIEKYQDQMLDYPLTLLNDNVWHYRMELHFTNHQRSSAQLREYNLTCTEECAAIYSPNSGRQRYCIDCGTWFHEKCMNQSELPSHFLPQNWGGSLSMLRVRGCDPKSASEPPWMCFGTGSTIARLRTLSIMNGNKIPTSIFKYFPEWAEYIFNRYWNRYSCPQCGRGI